MQKKLNRAAIFAHYDKNSKIEDYVVFYLKELNKIASKIVFVSDSDVDEKELEKIKPYTIKQIAKRHFEYDFGSYKRGVQFLKENNLLENFDELIFANDSTYAPLFDFKIMFEKMEKSNASFWGVTSNNEIQMHLQSYFLVFKKEVFLSGCFLDFISNVKKEKTKEDVVINYEVNLTNYLAKNGFSYDFYCKTFKDIPCNHLNCYRDLILKDNCPFLKRGLVLFNQIGYNYPLFIKNLIKKTSYDYSLIEKDKINQKPLSKFEHIKLFIKSIKKQFLKIYFKKRCVLFLGKWYWF